MTHTLLTNIHIAAQFHVAPRTINHWELNGRFPSSVRGAKDPATEPLADDLATLALDALVEQQGFFRTGPNPFLFSG